MIENEVNHDDDDGRQFSMDLSTHSRFAMAFDLKPPPSAETRHTHTHLLELLCCRGVLPHEVTTIILWVVCRTLASSFFNCLGMV